MVGDLYLKRSKNQHRINIDTFRSVSYVASLMLLAVFMLVSCSVFHNINIYIGLIRKCLSYLYPFLNKHYRFAKAQSPEQIQQVVIEFTE